MILNFVVCCFFYILNDYVYTNNYQLQALFSYIAFFQVLLQSEVKPIMLYPLIFFVVNLFPFINRWVTLMFDNNDTQHTALAMPSSTMHPSSWGEHPHKHALFCRYILFALKQYWTCISSLIISWGTANVYVIMCSWSGVAFCFEKQSYNDQEDKLPKYPYGIPHKKLWSS